MAITWGDSVAVLDSATLQRLQILEAPHDISLFPCKLIFSPDSRILTCCSTNYEKPFVVSWDLQTGGVVGVITWQGPEWNITVDAHDAKTVAITYSADGRMVGVFYCYLSVHDNYRITTNLSICDVASGVYMHSHSLDGGEILLPNNIWTHGESLQFVTAGAEIITVWEVGFTSGATPTEVETLPILDGFPDDGRGVGVQFLPNPCRLAFFTEECGVQVWDARNSKCLLDSTDAEFYGGMSFSSDGRFFTCSGMESETYLWKESPPNGYVLHEILVSCSEITYPLPSLSPTGELIVTPSQRAIQLWRTERSATSASSTLTQAPQITNSFVLDVSPDETLAVVAMKEGDTVTFLNLNSGSVQLTVNLGMEVHGLRVTGKAVGVICPKKVIIWNLPASNSVPDARINLEGSALMEELNFVSGTAISSDFRHIAMNKFGTLKLYSTSTGKCLGQTKPKWGAFGAPWFSPDGCNIWGVDSSGWADVFRIGGEQNVLERLEHRIGPQNLPEGYPWASSRYRVTKDWWLVLGRERLLMLPPPWRSEAIGRVWKGKFLALLHNGLSEPVILEPNAKS